MIGIKAATRAYESWLVNQIPLLVADLRLKHQRMTESLFAFLRATFYRWAQQWPEVCPELQGGAKIFSVGDLHVENFGTWRDSEGRLIWGVNDFDEACQIPYANDLVRLTVSAQFAVQENHLSCDLNSICEAILDGYVTAFEQGGRPFVLAERHVWLRDLATSELRDPVRFWDKLQKWKQVNKEVPQEVRQAIKGAMPKTGLPFRVVHRQAGLGSLGRRRFTALAELDGGLIAREAKELVPSAWHWASGSRRQNPLLYSRLIEEAVRVGDPFVQLRGKWLIRRLAPDCSRIELASLPKIKDELRLLRAMGWETANIHHATQGAAQLILRDLRQSPANWLTKASSAMAKALTADWQKWRAV
jgi:uncharacterized protein (DUF2252 family)